MYDEDVLVVLPTIKRYGNGDYVFILMESTSKLRKITIIRLNLHNCFYLWCFANVYFTVDLSPGFPQGVLQIGNRFNLATGTAFINFESSITGINATYIHSQVKCSDTRTRFCEAFARIVFFRVCFIKRVSIALADKCVPVLLLRGHSAASHWFEQDNSFRFQRFRRSDVVANDVQCLIQRFASTNLNAGHICKCLIQVM